MELDLAPDRSPVVEERLANISLKEDNINDEAENANVNFEVAAADNSNVKDEDAAADNSNVKDEDAAADNSNVKDEDAAADNSNLKDEDADREKFLALVKRSRQLAESGDIAKALQLNKKALAIHYSEKLEKRIKKMEAYLSVQEDSNSDDEENKEDMEDLGLGFKLHCSMAGKLYTHQKEGVLWLWTLFRKGKGGILADDMGLGKTIQVIAFLAGMFDMDKIKTVMIVVPLSVMPTWETEFAKWTPGIHVTQFHGNSKKERERALHRVRSRGGVILTTYGLIITQEKTLSERFGREFVWDYIILDEGHKIKNKTKTSTGMNNIPARNRIILTGTPVQNNLKELWSLFDFAHQGSLLGTVRTFKMQFETPITRARERDASAVQRRLGEEMSDALKKIIQPFFLRRTKKDVSEQGEAMQDSKCAKMPELTRKNDIVLWVHLNELQQKIYKDFLDLDEVKALLMTKKSPLVALTVLKKICDHPRLLSTRACMKLGLDGDDYDEEDLEKLAINESAANKIDNVPDDVLVGEAGKMGILIELLDNFKMEGHKTLVFSQSRKLLDMIERVITNRGHKVARLDGKVSSLEERKDIVNRFQKNPKYSVFLLTIQVGGVGLTITAADRVIIYDPSWNPAVDAQAVDRAYRIGQTENVVVHRLISCGTVEEKIYRRQVFKDSITRQTTGNAKNPYRYFTQMELRELFTLDDPRDSKTQRQLQEMHANQRVTDQSLDMHIAFLHSLDIFGISDHDLMFSQTHNRDDEVGDENPFIGQQEHTNNEQFIQYKIQQAQALIAEESNNLLTYEERTTGVMKFANRTRQVDPGALAHQVQPSGLFTHVSSMPTGSVASDVIDLSDDGGRDEDNDDSDVEEIEHPSPHLETIEIDDSDDADVDIKPSIQKDVQSVDNDFDQRVQHYVEIKTEKPDSGSVEQMNESGDHSITVLKNEVTDSVENVPRLGMDERDDSDNEVAVNDDDGSIEIYDNEEENECKNESDVLKKTTNNDSDSDINSDSNSSSDSEIKKRGPFSLSISRCEEGSKSEIYKRALQPLTQADVDRRSPMIMKDKSLIVSEEIMISPDCNQPLIGLEVSKSGQKKSVRNSSTTTTPNRPSSSRKLKLSALKNSPNNASQSSIISSPVGCSPQPDRRVNLHKSYFQSSSSTPREAAVGSPSTSSSLENVLAAESRESSILQPAASVENSPSASFNTSGARRSLSFGMESSPELVSKRVKSGRMVIEESDEEEENGQENEKMSSATEVIGESDDDERLVDKEEEEEEDEDNNTKFQDLIMVARTLYKQKEYMESLHYVEEALTIFQEPELEIMAEKIRSKLNFDQQ